ncbi:hypothetical protein ES675_11120 [Bizionia algoritergicola]|uniref:Uncharacterized protein n=1 Tax=Bizionia algoritergicola TaxID=291187 RepID=A0A5D0QT00_9FLAO|nr:hypothetical protein ES675_11120 [Bizionia algoritergicola]
MSFSKTKFTIHYSLFTIHYSLFTIHYSLFTIHYSLFTIHYSSVSNLSTLQASGFILNMGFVTDHMLLNKSECL